MSVINLSQSGGGGDISLTGNWADNCIMRSDGDQDNKTFQGSISHVTDTGHMSLGQVAAPEGILELWANDAHPILSITAAHATDYDPQIQFRTDVTDTVKCSIGVDSGDINKLKIYMGEGSGDTNHFVIDQNGKVGIGVSNPSSHLQVVTDSQYAGLFIGSKNTGEGAGLTVRSTAATETNRFADIGLESGGPSYKGSVSISPTDIHIDTLGIVKGLNITAFQADTDIGFTTWNTVKGARNSAMIIKTGTGFVGIGTTAPETLVEMTSTVPYFTHHNSTEEDIAGGRESIDIYKGETQAGAEHVLAKMTVAHDGAAADQKAYWALALNDGDDGDNPTEYMRLLSNGYLGLGETPTAQLHTTKGRINGTTRTTTTATLDTDDEIVYANTDSGAYTVTLPTGVEGTHYKIMNTGTSGNDLTIAPDGTEQIWKSGAGTSIVLSDGDILNLHYSNEDGWW